MNFGSRGFRQLSSDRQTYIHTESTEIIKHAVLRVVNNFRSSVTVKQEMLVTTINDDSRFYRHKFATCEMAAVTHDRKHRRHSVCLSVIQNIRKL